MNRVDRLFAIMLELQAHGTRRAEDLAQTFETSKRTIYRDIEALGESGIPIIAIPGQGYSLVKDYFLPPLSFSPDEATILLLGANFVANAFDAQYRKTAHLAMRKIEGVLSEQKRAQVQSLQNSLRFVSGIDEVDEAVRERLRLLRGAILDRRRVKFRYYARFAEDNKGDMEWREVEPYTLTHFEQAWYISARDIKKDDVRRFRLDRMADLSLLLTQFQQPLFEALEQLQTQHNREDRPIMVKALFNPKIARWVREQRSFFVVNEQAGPEGLLVTFTVRHEDELLQYLLGWGAGVQVLQPLSLRQRLIEEAQKMISVNS